jgi:hypothetical protein
MAFADCHTGFLQYVSCPATPAAKPDRPMIDAPLRRSQPESNALSILSMSNQMTKRLLASPHYCFEPLETDSAV